MKTLILMRHAKSSWDNTELDDQDRPLNRRGEKDAPRMGKLLFERELIPEQILCSTAMRTRQTALAVAEECKYTREIVYLDSFYMAEAETYLAELAKLSEEFQRVMVIGHNPGLESLCQRLSGEIVTLRTGAIASISLNISRWDELDGSTSGQMIEFWQPRDLKEESAEKRDKDEKAAKPKKKDEPKKEKKKEEKKKADKKETEKEKKSDSDKKKAKK